FGSLALGICAARLGTPAALFAGAVVCALAVGGFVLQRLRGYLRAAVPTSGTISDRRGRRRRDGVPRSTWRPESLRRESSAAPARTGSDGRRESRHGRVAGRLDSNRGREKTECARYRS